MAKFMGINKKTVLFLLLGIFTLTCPSFLSAQDVEAPEDLKVFLNGFVEAAKAGNKDQIMALMDADYKKEQHDAFLEGDTEKFLNKFFCGYDPSDGERYECMVYTNLKELKLTTVLPDTDLYIVLFHVTDNDSTVEVTWIVSAKKIDGKPNYGMVGTYG